MASTFCFGATNTGQGTVLQNTTRYYQLGHGFPTNNATEVNQQVPWRLPCTLTSFYARVATNTLTSTAAFTVRKNTANGNGTFTVGSAVTGEFSDPVNKDVIAAGDVVDFSVVATAGGTSIIFTSFGVTVVGAPVRKCLSGSGTSFFANAANAYAGLNRQNTTSGGTEAGAQFKAKAAGSLSNLFAYVITNLRATSDTVFTRINGASGTVTITIAALTTGAFEDTTHTDSFVSGDLLNLVYVGGIGVDNVIMSTLALDLQSPTLSLPSLNCIASGAALVASTTYYIPFGSFSFITTPESTTQSKAWVPQRATNLEAYIITNAASGGNSTLKLRVDGADGNNTLTVGASATGYFEITTAIDVLSPTSEVNYQAIVASGGTLTPGSIGCLLQPLPSQLAALGAG